jgi:hypothetical protein
MKKCLLGIMIFLFSVTTSYALTISTIKATWNAPTGPGKSTVTYSSDKSEIRYGQVDFGAQKSGLRFDESETPLICDINQVFEIGLLTHYNNPTYAGTEIDSVDLALAMNFSDPAGLNANYEFDFGINNTPNIYNPDTNPKNNDVISFSNTFAPTSVNIGGTLYTLQILGFGSSPTSNFVTQLSSVETKTNSSILWGKVTAVPPSPSPAPVPEPATMLLLGSGLLGLAGFRRKGNEKHKS